MEFGISIILQKIDFPFWIMDISVYSLIEFLLMMVAIKIQVKVDNKIDPFSSTIPNIAPTPFAFILHISSYSRISNRYQPIQLPYYFEISESFPKKD